eukprot:872305-Amorphochlora_amoeboformis.AAC.1
MGRPRPKLRPDAPDTVRLAAPLSSWILALRGRCLRGVTQTNERLHPSEGEALPRLRWGTIQVKVGCYPCGATQLRWGDTHAKAGQDGAIVDNLGS